MFGLTLITVCCWLASMLSRSAAIPKQNFYAYGPTHGDLDLPPWDDYSSEEIQLDVPICLFGRCYRSVFVNSNGLLSFTTELPNYSNVEITKLRYPVIAIFYADVDISPEGLNGRIVYRTTDDAELLQKSAEMVQSKWHIDGADYEPKLLLIATWDSVGRYSAQTDKKNSFQLVISTDGNSSYAELLYADDEINWIESTNKFPNSPTAQAGFAAPHATPYLLPQSNAPTMLQITEHTNVGLPGMFLYRISDKEINGKTTADEEDYDYEDYSTESDEAAASQDGDHEDNDNQVEQTMDQCPIDPRICQQQGCGIRTNSEGCPECLCGQEVERQPYENTVPTVVICQDDPYRGRCPEGCPLVAYGSCQRCHCHYTTPTTSAPSDSSSPYGRYHGREQCYDCHRLAECEHLAQGSCCRCQSGLIGDGKECVKEDEAQRVSGKLTGRLNGVDLVDSELHAYAVLTDGRSYTAFSRVPQSLGPSMLLLNTLGSIMGWVFAKPVGSTENGFSLTGGRFNRSATVHVSDRYMVTIQQDFMGRDDYQYLRCETFISGSLPVMPADASVEYADHFEEFVRADKTVIKSYSNLIATIGQNRYPVIVDQTIRFQPCPHLAHRIGEKLLLRADRSYSMYDQNEQIVRYASGNTVETPGAAESHDNPCRDGAHDCTGPNMECVAEGQRYRCTCGQGYRMQAISEVGRRLSCIDIDECSQNQHRCDPNANCHNVEGGYLCQCHAGYEGDGYRCTMVTGEQRGSCGGRQCSANAVCQVDSAGQEYCVCNTGYEQDQISGQCLPSTTEQPEKKILGTVCRSHDECSKHGQCVYNEAVKYYQCQCRPPYSGDGTVCFLEAETCQYAHNCHEHADCVYEQHELGGGYRCRCRPGFTGNGYDCRPLENLMQQIQCNVLNNCGQRAECVFDVTSNSHVCSCLPGFKGDGYVCHPDESDKTSKHSCQSSEDCHLNAHCIMDERSERYICECLPGFKGDGKAYCEAADECNPGTDVDGCALHAACVYSDRTQAYTCQCMHGYTGDGKVCTEMQIKDCSMDRSLCHRDAQCTYDHHVAGYVCKCNPSFSGDGYYSCQQTQGKVCDTQNACDRNARCIPASDGYSFSCVCNEGYEGDGYRCHQITDCITTPKMCDENADCVSENMRYTCRCRSGFHGSGFTCRPDSKARGKSLIFSHGMTLVQRGLQPEDYGKQLVVVPFQIAVGVDFDCQQEKIYWSDVSGHSIRTANLDGSNITLLFDQDLSSPEGICVDWINGNLYYVDSVRDEIGLFSLKTKSRLPIATDGLYNPRALALDPVDRKLYYSDWNRQRPVIGRLNLDGTGREPYVTSEIALPNGLVVLPRRRELCWADAGLQRLECMGVSHSGGRHVVHAPLGYPFGLTVHNEETFYWTDWEDKRIHSVSIYGGDHQSMMPAAGGSGKMYGIVAIPSECFTGESGCTVNNGGCKYICVPGAYGNRRCLCPEGVSEAECNQL